MVITSVCYSKQTVNLAKFPGKSPVHKEDVSIHIFHRIFENFRYENFQKFTENFQRLRNISRNLPGIQWVTHTSSQSGVQILQLFRYGSSDEAIDLHLSFKMRCMIDRDPTRTCEVIALLLKFSFQYWNLQALNNTWSSS